MTTIKASCPTCGDIERTPRQVRLVICTIPTRSFYSFTCPKCLSEINKPANQDVVTLLRSGGVTVEQWVIPKEALDQRAGEPLTTDDLLDFILTLEHADLLAAAAEPTCATGGTA